MLVLNKPHVKNMIKKLLKTASLLTISYYLLINSAKAQTITSVSPLSGAVGTIVTIKGSALAGTTAFSIGGVNAITISNTDTSLVGMVMPDAATGAIQVTTAGGTANAANNFTVRATTYPSMQQGNKLVGTGAQGKAGSQQGCAVAVSADGNTAVVGAGNDSTSSTSTGAVWVYTRVGNSWVQQGQKLVGTDGLKASEGSAVAISADGNTIVFGGPTDSTTQGTEIADPDFSVLWGATPYPVNTGGIWVFTRSAGVWTQQGNKIQFPVASTLNSYALQGKSLSLSADGNTVLIGAPGDNGGGPYGSVGAGWVFKRKGNTWQKPVKLVGTGYSILGDSVYLPDSFTGFNKLCVYPNTSIATSVVLSADGNTAILGAPNDSMYHGNFFGIGAAWVFTRINDSTWAQQGTKLVGAGAIGSMAAQGYAVAISADGNTAMVGGFADNSTGAVWVFTRSNGVWTQQGSKIVPTGTVSSFGISISLSADGNVAMIGGSPNNNSIGGTYVFTRSGGVWSQQTLLVGTGCISNNGVGYGQSGIPGSVSLTPDASTLFVGASIDNNDAGAAWVFTTVTHPTTATLSPVACGSVTVNATTYTATGTYTQMLTNAAGFDSTLTILATVNIPTTATVSPVACNSVTVNAVTYTTSGTYTQNFTNINGCDSTLYIIATVNMPTTATVSPVACNSVTVNAVTYTTSGTYTQNFTNINGCDSTLYIIATVHMPTADTLKPTGCDSVTVNAVTYTTSGTYTQILTNANGCDSTLTIIATINTQPTLTITPTQTICAGSTTTLTAGGATTYTWSTAATGASVSVSPTTNATYTVVGANNGCVNTATTSLAVNPLPIVTYTLISTGVAQVWDISATYPSNALSANWNWGDGNSSSGLYPPTHTFAAAGKYNICVDVTDSAGCTTTYCQNDSVYRSANGTMVSVTVVQGQVSVINKVVNNNEVSVYPNPSNGNFVVTTTVHAKAISVSDVLGNELLMVTPTNNNTNINLSAQANGIYFVKIITNNAQIVKRMVINN